MGTPRHSRYPVPTKASNFVGGLGLLLFIVGANMGRIPDLYVAIANVVMNSLGKPPVTEGIVTALGNKLAIGGASAFLAAGIAYVLAQVFDRNRATK